MSKSSDIKYKIYEDKTQSTLLLTLSLQHLYIFAITTKHKYDLYEHKPDNGLYNY